MIDLSKIARANIQKLRAYSSARDEFSGNEGVFLDANESPYGILNRYPDPYQSELKSVLANLKQVQPEQIFIGNGSDEAIDLLFRIFCEPVKDRALTFAPTYGMYDVSAEINAVELVKIPLNRGFDIDLEEALKVISDQRLKLVFICSPNNPTGNLISIKSIERLLASFHGLVVVDEAYIDFSSGKSWVESLNRFSNLVVLQTMSKARGLAAARVGFAFGNPSVIELMNRVKPPYNVSSLNQQAALTALSDGETFEIQVQQILQERGRLKGKLLELKSVVSVYPSEANFLLVEFVDGQSIYKELVKRKIIVRNRANQVNNGIRITVGTPAENDLLLSELIKIEDEESTVY